MSRKLDLLPDGTLFCFWQPKTAYSRTYHVAQQAPGANDGNPGTKESPFRTIGAAAAILQPGEQVIIHAGTYRELVQPQRGGLGPESMISYEAAEDDQVILSGTERWKTNWQPSEGWHHTTPEPGARVWYGALPPDGFHGVNPFCLINLPKAAHTSKDVVNARLQHDRPEYWMRRGLVFVDGVALRQVLDYQELWEESGTYWVEDDGMAVHLRLPKDSYPQEHELEYTARAQVFQPAVPYQGYIRVSGLTLEKVGNGIPVPQRGALSTFCGHHWIIENNKVHWANSIGIDTGHQTWHRESQELAGGHIVRGNLITHCGVCGLCGVGGGKQRNMPGILVEKNIIESCGWLDVEHIYENAGIKIHNVTNSLVRDNVIVDTRFGPGIWCDFTNQNARVSGNVVYNTESTLCGGIFLEASHKPNQVDNNIVWKVGKDKAAGRGGHGIYEHDSDYILVEHNLVTDCEGAAVYLNLGQVDRIAAGRGSTGRRHTVRENLLLSCGQAIVFPTPDNHADGNLFGTFGEPGPLRIQSPQEILDLEAWRDFHGWDRTGQNVILDLWPDPANQALSITFPNSTQTVTVSWQDRLDLKEALEMVRQIATDASV